MVITFLTIPFPKPRMIFNHWVPKWYLRIESSWVEISFHAWKQNRQFIYLDLIKVHKSAFAAECSTLCLQFYIHTHASTQAQLQQDTQKFTLHFVMDNTVLAGHHYQQHIKIMISSSICTLVTWLLHTDDNFCFSRPLGDAGKRRVVEV